MKWEKGKNWNVGIDFSLFNYRLNGSVNYYSRKQQDLLGVYDVALPPNGASQSFVNVGTMKNTGVEIELDWNAVKSKNFNYTISFVEMCIRDRPYVVCPVTSPALIWSSELELGRFLR